MSFMLITLMRMSCLCHLDEDALDQDRMFQQPVCNQEITPGYIRFPLFALVCHMFIQEVDLLAKSPQMNPLLINDALKSLFYFLLAFRAHFCIRWTR